MVSPASCTSGHQPCRHRRPRGSHRQGGGGESDPTPPWSWGVRGTPRWSGAMMNPLTGTVAFFDIGGTLASAVLSARGDRIEQLAVYPYVPGVLRQLRERGARLGIMSDPGSLPHEELDRALDEAGLRDLLEPELVVYGPKDSPRIFQQAIERAGAAGRVLFVGEDAGERAQALRAGLLVAPHPQLAAAVLDEQAHLRY